MTTQQTTWTIYNGSDEQTAEMWNSVEGFLVNNVDRIQEPGNFVSEDHIKRLLDKWAISHYWIIPDDPLRDMKVRQALSGQPVWQRHVMEWDRRSDTIEVDCTTAPDWNIPNAEYSFTPFDGENK